MITGLVLVSVELTENSYHKAVSGRMNITEELNSYQGSFGGDWMMGAWR